MGYIVAQTDIETRIGLEKLIQLTDDSKAGSVDVDNMNQAIADAEAEAESYCSARYDIPMTTVTTILKAKTLDIVIYNLYKRRRGATENVKEEYKSAIAFFDKVGKGMASLGEISEASPDATPDAGGPRGSKGEEDRLFTEKALGNF